ncbi:MAG: hypothetical protein EXX96DRAFT_562379 [Benjaminiella poitrasii]|nr:MAG: hypothetical protein EXX96DRAFT_562379 [Benjaminiella poitrasii]
METIRFPTIQKPPSEFTRRKNWSQTVIEELHDVFHVLSSNLTILYCSPALRECLGYQPSELTGRDMTDFLHLDDIDGFRREFLNHHQHQVLRVTYRFQRKDGRHQLMEIRGQFCQRDGPDGYYFVSARTIPTETARMIDTFLDYKMQNEFLSRKLRAFEAPPSPPPSQQEAITTVEPSKSTQEPPVLEPRVADTLYAQGVLSTYGVDESVALFTGLHFGLGERSRGISMGLEEAELFRTSDEERLADTVSGQKVRLYPLSVIWV